METFFAHTANQQGRWEPQAEHSSHVAALCRHFGIPLGIEHQASATGVVHDLGKYADQYMRRLQGQDTPRDHSLPGALAALRCYKHLGLLPAIAILAHHGGLGELPAGLGASPAWRQLANKLCKIRRDRPQTITETDLGLLMKRFAADKLELPKISAGLEPAGFDADDMLDARMLFSVLVDADFIETEAHFEGDHTAPRKYRPVGPPLDPQAALEAVERHVAQLAARGHGSPQVDQMRNDLRRWCLTAADQPIGLMTLSAPTGSGKTLAMLSFALRHAIRHNLRRIVLVMPFLNIIDQTAELYRSIFFAKNGFPANYVLEDHSLAGRGDEPPGQADAVDQDARTRRLLAENWDSPIVLTTNVKCLESLMANRPAACRKLHRLARAVVMFDEVQTLPPELAPATLATLARLNSRFGSTILFATATQPAFEHLDEPVRAMSSVGWSPAKIVPPAESAEMFAVAAKRTIVHWEHGQPITLECLADRLLSEPTKQVLCIVNLRRHASRLAALLRERRPNDVLHLSTNMCPLHRQRVLAQVNERLKSQSPKPILLVATQCVEAGVDLDFPVVYRAMAPLEAIAQAAGRCNRHGLRPEPGHVYVFMLDDSGKAIFPPGYKQAVGATLAFLAQQLHDVAHQPDVLHDPDRLRYYFSSLYTLTGLGQGASRKERELRQALKTCDFAEVARLYRLISEDTINILVPYDRATCQELVGRMHPGQRRSAEQIRQWVQDARPHAVSIYRPKEDQSRRYCDPLLTEIEIIPLNRAQETDQEPGEWYRLLNDDLYDRDLLGLREAQADYVC